MKRNKKSKSKNKKKRKNLNIKMKSENQIKRDIMKEEENLGDQGLTQEKDTVIGTHAVLKGDLIINVNRDDPVDMMIEEITTEMTDAEDLTKMKAQRRKSSQT